MPEKHTISAITEREQLAAIADPNRMAILRLLMAQSSTLTQLAERLDSYPAHVRYHVKRLEAAGLVRLGKLVTTKNYTEKFWEATAAAFTVHLLVIPEHGADRPVAILGSHDIALEALTELADRPGAARVYSPVAIGSLDGLVALRQGLADIAGCHLLDPEGAEYNVPFVKHLFPDRSMAVITLAHREQGLMVSPGNPMDLGSIEDLAQQGIRFVNRNRGSGTRTWFDAQLRTLGLPHDSIPGYDCEVVTHNAAAEAIASGSADVALGIRAAAVEAGLGFIPLFTERYDLVMDEDRVKDPQIEHLLDTLCAASFGQRLRQYEGYDTSHTGDGSVVSA